MSTTVVCQLLTQFLTNVSYSYVQEPTYTVTREESIEQANAYHEVAAKLNDMRHLYFQKAKESYNSGNHAVALFYRELVGDFE